MSEELTQITDHARRAIFSLNPEFWGKPRIMSFTWAFASEVQELENAIFSVIQLRMVDNAFDAQLKVLGRLVGQANVGGFDTELYRALIKAKIRTNRSHGSLRDILEAGWATLGLVTENTGALVLDALSIVLRNAKQAEEGILLYVSQTPQGLRGDSYTSTAAATGGWGTVTNASVGGLAFHVRQVSSGDS
jgi:hypothetical protein